MNIFLQEFASEIGNKKVILVVDGAGWHKSKGLIVPENIKLIFLPPYSPELNPIERLWLYIKHHTIRNRLYTTIKELEDVVCHFLRNINSQIITSICQLSYSSSYM
jgi:transposase